VALNTNIEIHSKFAQIFPIVTIFSNIQIQVVFYSKVVINFNIIKFLTFLFAYQFVRIFLNQNYFNNGFAYGV
jgi:hypothetical protein